ncbi:MAG: right-handed parallel beta-helix repeat-containing protein [Candidatus Thorarchaeota archaeon]
MQKKPLMIIVLVILMAQPFVVVSSMPFAFSENAVTPEKEIIVSQGTRLVGGALTDHVPVLIDEEADFTTQGWPGAGTEGDPWIISGLNITYNVAQPCIEIRDVTSYFVVRDCYVGQLANENGVRFDNVTHGVLEYTTINSTLGYGMVLLDANNTLVAHSVIQSDGSNAIAAQDSFYSTIDANYIVNYGLDILSCPNITVSNNEIADVSGFGIYIDDTNSSIIESNWIYDCTGDGIGLNYAHHTQVLSNTIENTGGDGIFVGLSEYSTIEDNVILYSGDSGIQFNTYEWISILSNTINYSYTYPINAASSGISNGEIIGNFVAHSSGSSSACIALQGGNHENFTITDNYFEDEWGGLFTQPSGRWINFYRNYAKDMGSYLVGMQSFTDVNIINNTMQGVGQWGVYTDTGCDRTSVVGNLFNETWSIGILAEGQDMTVLNNSVYDSPTGIQIGGANAVVQYNTFTDHNLAIDVNSDNALIDSNTISDTTTGIDVSDFTSGINITNNVIHDMTGTGIQLRGANQLADGNTIANSYYAISLYSVNEFELRDNIIGSSNTGIYVFDSLDGEVAYNNMTDCGVYFALGSSIAQLNHTFEENYVNDKPLFYGFENNGESLSGDTYGEIILVNCSDAVINGGLFSSSTVAIQLFYSDRANIAGIGIMNQDTGITVVSSINMTISDSNFSAEINDQAIDAITSPGFTADNVNVVDTYAGIRITDSVNSTVIDSEFSNIDTSAIRVDDAYYYQFQGNTIFNAQYGIDISNAFSSEMIDNDISFCDRAINAWSGSADWDVAFNNLHENGYGIMMDDSFAWTIYNNTIRWNGYGIYMTNTNDDATVYNNTIALSTYYNGFCDGADLWDDHVDGGNYWNDYSGTGTYPLPGGTAEDRYPIKYVVTKPIINSPMDFSYAEGSEGNFITWVPFDDNLKDWAVTIDGGAWASDAWNFENITINVDGLVYGDHTVFILVEDLYGNSVNDTVIVTVFDDTAPGIFGPPDTWLFEDAADQIITWEVSDLNPNNYTVYLNGEVFDTGTWETGDLVIDFEGVTEGLYSVLVVIHDIDANEATDYLMFLMIKDDTSPIINHPGDLEYIVGTTGNDVVWDPSDEFPASYVVTFNGTPYESDTWGGSRIAINVDGMPVGLYELTITVYDMSGNFATDTVNVTVLPLVLQPPLPLIDWVILAIIGAVVGGIIVVIALVYYLKKKKGST